MESIMTQSMEQFKKEYDNENQNNNHSDNDNENGNDDNNDDGNHENDNGNNNENNTENKDNIDIEKESEIVIKEVETYLELPQNWEKKTDEYGITYYVDTETGEWYRVNNKKHKRINTNEKLHIIT
eukprot:391120_1